MVAGSKRSVRDRLGTNVVDSSTNRNKRQRGPTAQVILNVSHSNDAPLGKNDLRFKLLQRNIYRKIPNSGAQSNIDLRDRLLSRAVKRSVHTNTVRSTEVALETRQSVTAPRNTSMLGHNSSGRTMSDFPVDVPARTSYSSLTFNNLRQKSPDVMHSSSSTVFAPERNLSQLQTSMTQPLGEEKSSSYMRSDRLSPSRPNTSIPPVDGKSSLCMQGDRLSPSSPVSSAPLVDGKSSLYMRGDRLSPSRPVSSVPFLDGKSGLYMRGDRLSPSRPFSSVPLVDGKSSIYMGGDRPSPSRPISSVPLVDGKSSIYMRGDRPSPSTPICSVPLIDGKSSLYARGDRLSPSRPVSSIPLGDVKSSLCTRSDRLSPSRPVSSVPLLAKTSVPIGPVPSKLVAAVVPQFPPSKIPYVGDECLTVESLLQSLGLEKYTIHFKHEEVDMHALRQMGENDLKELGIPMGPRKKILQAMLPRSRRQS